MRRLFVTIFVLLAFVPVASAHHSKVAHFDTSRYVTIEGEVVKWRFRSPHSSMILNVTAEDGTVEKWTIEGSAAPTLKRQGMDRKTFLPGDKIRIRAEPSRNPNANVAFALTFQTADGRILGARMKLDEGEEFDSSNIKGIQRLAGRWQGLGAGQRFPVSLNDKGQAVWEAHDDAKSPANTCEPLNIPSILHVPNFLFDVRIEDDKAIITHEIYQITRTVPLSDEAEKAESTGRFGYIKGRIEGDDMIIESDRYLPSGWGLAPAAIPPGNGGDIPSSDQKRVTERYISKDDGKTLRIEYTIEDPVYLAEPYVGYRDFGRIADDTPIHPYECDPASASSFVEQAKQDDRGGKPKDKGELRPGKGGKH